MKIAFQMDPIEYVDINADSTFRLAEEAQNRGYDLYVYTPNDLTFNRGKIVAKVRSISLKRKIYNKTFLATGFSVGYLLNWGEEINGYNEMGSEVNNLDYNIHVGIDYKLTKKLYLNTRLANSIFPIRKHASEQTYRWNRGQYNTSLSFILYYYIGASKN